MTNIQTYELPNTKGFLKLRLVIITQTLDLASSSFVQYPHGLNKLVAVDGFYTTTTISNNRILPAHGNGNFQTDVDADYSLATFDITRQYIEVEFVNYNSSAPRTIIGYFILNADVSGY
jgi:hypothetical protein